MSTLAALRRSPRWRPLVEFVAAWNARPLGDDDGVRAAEVDDAERRLGRPLPAAVREWHLLLGARLRPVRLEPVPLGTLDARVVVEALPLCAARDPAGLWAVLPEDLARPDPPVSYCDPLGPPRWHAAHERASELYFAALLHETLWMVESADLQGPLGPLRRGVQADCSTELVRLDARALEELARSFALQLPTWRWPQFPTRLYADEDVLLRLVGMPECGADEHEVTIAARSRAAWRRAWARFDR